MPEYLLEGLRNTAIAGAVHAMALLTILVWCDLSYAQESPIRSNARCHFISVMFELVHLIVLLQ